MLALRLPADIEERLEAVAKKTGRTKSSFAREAILEKLEEMEDYAVAVERVRTMGKTLAWEEVAAELDKLDAGGEASE